MKKKDLTWVLGSLFAVIFLDQASKHAVLKYLPQIHLEYFHITLHFNKGAMLGLFSDLPPVLRIVSLSTGGAFLLFSFVIFQSLQFSSLNRETEEDAKHWHASIDRDL